jgi:hypothetical protein
MNRRVEDINQVAYARKKKFFILLQSDAFEVVEFFGPPIDFQV